MVFLNIFYVYDFILDIIMLKLKKSLENAVQVGPIFERCVICLENDAVYACIPCAHQVICGTCVKDQNEIFERCPLCRRFVRLTSKMKLE